MKIQALLEYNNPNISPQLKKLFDNIFKKLQSAVKEATDIDVNPKWVSGLLKQAHTFKNLDSQYEKVRSNGADNTAPDLLARITARNVLVSAGIATKTGIEDNRTASLMKQYYTQPIHDENEMSDAGKLARSAAESEYQDWFNTLSKTEQNYVNNIQQLTSKEFSEFKGIVTARDHKKQFLERISVWTQSSDVAFKLFSNMGLVDSSGKINGSNIEQFRSFLETLSIPRLKDIISKSMVYTGKKMAHDEQRAANAVLKKIENGPNSTYTKIINIYNKITPTIMAAKDKRRAIYRTFENIPGTIDEDKKLTKLGRGVLALFKVFRGESINQANMDAAIKDLNSFYDNPATRDRRNDKAESRGEKIKSMSEF